MIVGLTYQSIDALDFW